MEQPSYEGTAVEEINQTFRGNDTQNRHHQADDKQAFQRPDKETEQMIDECHGRNAVHNRHNNLFHNPKQKLGNDKHHYPSDKAGNERTERATHNHCKRRTRRNNLCARQSNLRDLQPKRYFPPPHQKCP